MKRVNVWLLLVSILTVGFSAAGEEAKISGPIRFIGNGCLPSYTESVVTEDRMTASFLFSKFAVETGKSIHRFFEARWCEIRIPLTVSPGYKIQVQGLDYRGFKSMALHGDRTAALFETQILSRGVLKSSGLNLVTENGPFRDEFFYEPTKKVTSFACGGAMELRVRTQVSAFSNSCRAGSMSGIEIDSIDFTSQANAGDFTYVPCR